MYLSLSLGCITVCAFAYDYGTGFSGVGYSWHSFEDFYELCPGDEFEHNDLKVNALFPIQGLLDLIPIINYALDPADYHRLFKKPDADQLDEIRSNYHQQLLELFGLDYLNDPLYREKMMYQKFKALQTNLTSFCEKGKNPLMSKVILEMQTRKIEKAKNFSLILDTCKNDGPVPGETVLAALNKVLSYLKKEISDANATIVFSADEIADIFNKRVYKFDHFKPKNIAKTPKYWEDYYGRLYFTMHIPIEQRDSKWVNKTRPCVPAKELPKFYQLKGKLNQ